MLGNTSKLGENVEMTDEKAILSEIEQLPETLKQEVRHYVEFLLQQYSMKKPLRNKKRMAGSAEGKYKLAADFDAPLKEFKEYT